MEDIKEEFVVWYNKIEEYMREGKYKNEELAGLIAACPCAILITSFTLIPQYNFDDPQYVKEAAGLPEINFTCKVN